MTKCRYIVKVIGELDKTPNDYLASMITPEFRFYTKYIMSS